MLLTNFDAKIYHNDKVIENQAKIADYLTFHVSPIVRYHCHLTVQRNLPLKLCVHIKSNQIHIQCTHNNVRNGFLNL